MQKYEEFDKLEDDWNTNPKFPVTITPDKFNQLMDQWEQETIMHSDIAKAMLHPNKKLISDEFSDTEKIIYLLSRIKLKPSWICFQWLSELAERKPEMKEEWRGKFDEIRNMWLAWSVEEGYAFGNTYAYMSTDNANPEVVLKAMWGCAVGWNPDARIMGNIRAGDILTTCHIILERLDKLKRMEENLKIMKNVK